MQLRVIPVDITPQLLAQQLPGVLWKRPMPENDGMRRIVPSAAQLTTGDVWWILQNRMDKVNSSSWSFDQSSPQFRIPLFCYELPKPELEDLTCMASQIGASAAILAQAKASATEQTALELLLAVGNVYTRRNQEPGFEAWFGFAARFSKRRV